MSKFLSREAILNAEDLPRETVAVPEWGGDVCVRGLTGSERDSFEAEIVEQRGKRTHINLANIRAKLVARAVIDPETGQRLFNNDGDVAALGRKSAAALQRVFDAARRLSGLTEGDVEELAKNSESEPSGATGSA